MREYIVTHTKSVSPISFVHISIEAKDGDIVSYNEMKIIKEHLTDNTMVQIFPKKGNHIDNANVYHLWDSSNCDMSMLENCDMYEIIQYELRANKTKCIETKKDLICRT